MVIIIIIIIIVIISFQKKKEPHSPKTSVLFLILEAFLLDVLSHGVCWVNKVLVTIATDTIFKFQTSEPNPMAAF